MCGQQCLRASWVAPAAASACLAWHSGPHGMIPIACCRWALYPPEPAKLREVYELGYRDALRWLAKNGRVPYGAHPPVDPCMRAHHRQRLLQRFCSSVCMHALLKQGVGTLLQQGLGLMSPVRIAGKEILRLGMSACAGVIQQHEAAPDAAEDVPLWLSVLQETAAQAHSCEAELGELVLGAGALVVS